MMIRNEPILKEKTNPELYPGRQITYVPPHCNGDPDHEDAEDGFVVSARGPSIACRFWSKHVPDVLRTTTCSEVCNERDLVLRDTHSKELVDQLLGYILQIESQNAL